MLSGERIGQWIYKHWPFDVYATIAVFIVLVCASVIIFLKMKPEMQSRLKKCISWCFFQMGSAIIGMMTLPWKIVRGLIMEEDSEGRYQFAGFKMMFMLCSFVMLFRLGFSGGSIAELRVGPPSTVKKVKKNRKSRKSRKNKATSHKKDQYAVYIKKLEFSHVAFYELMVFLAFCFMYYYRKDLNEGDEGNGLDRVLDTAREAILYKYGGRPVDMNPIVKESTEITQKEEIKVTTIKKGKGRGRRSTSIISEADDPFLQ